MASLDASETSGGTSSSPDPVSREFPPFSVSTVGYTPMTELWTVTQTWPCTVQTWHYELWAVPAQFLTPDCAADEAWNQANWSPGQSSSGQLPTPDSALVNVRRNLSSGQPVTCNPADVEAENRRKTRSSILLRDGKQVLRLRRSRALRQLVCALRKNTPFSCPRPVAKQIGLPFDSSNEVRIPSLLHLHIHPQ